MCLWNTFPSLAQFDEKSCTVESMNAHGSYWPSILCTNGLRCYYFTSQATFDGNGLKFHIECATKYKTAYPLWFGPLRAALVLCHPDSLRVILSNHVPKEEFVYSLLVPFTGKQVNQGNSMERGWEKVLEGRSLSSCLCLSLPSSPSVLYPLYFLHSLQIHCDYWDGHLTFRRSCLFLLSRNAWPIGGKRCVTIEANHPSMLKCDVLTTIIPKNTFTLRLFILPGNCS